MKGLSRAALAIPRSGIREVMELAATMQDVIHLEVGEPSFNTPSHVIQAAFADAAAGYTKYTPNAGLRGLRAAIAERVSARWDRPISPEQVVVTTGAVGALAAAVFAIAEEGDEVLVPDPGWPNYHSIAQLSRANPVRYRLRPEDEYVPQVEEVAARLTGRTKAIIFNSPGNPTGAVLPAQRVAELLELARARDIYVVSDEVYEELVFEGVHASAGRYDTDGRVVVVSGCSKTYAMTGWRLGYAIAAPPLASLMSKLQEPLVSCASSISQRAAEAAILGPQDEVEVMRRAYQRRRDLVCDLLGPARLLASEPHGAFYAMLDLRHLGLNSRVLATRLLQEERVATAPGDTFGPSGEGMLRISLAASEAELEEACRRIEAFVQRNTPGAVSSRASVLGGGHSA